MRAWERRGGGRAVLWGLGLIGVVLACRAGAGEKPVLAFVKQVDLVEVGVRIRLMVDAQETPPGSPAVHTYTYKSGTNTWKEEQYDPADLWRLSQCAGKWVGRHGHTLILGHVERPQPKGFPREHVTREAYQERVAALAAQGPPEWNEETLTRWVADFAGVNKAVGQPLEHPPLRLQPVFVYTLGDPPTNMVAYLFGFNPAAAGQRGAPGGLFCALFRVHRDADMAQVRRAIEKDFLGTLAYVGTTRTTVTKPAQPAPRPAGPAPAARSAEFLASRQQVLDSIRNLKDWWYLETEHYLILSNMKRGGGNVVVERLRNDLEILRTAFAECVPPVRPIEAVSVLRIFATGEEFMKYVDPGYQWALGLWVPSRKELLVRPVEWGSTKDKRADVYQTVYHEAFHQYLHYALDQRDAALWFNEGHADMFAGAKIVGGKLTVDENDWRVWRLERMIESDAFDLERLLRMDARAFYSGDPEDNYTLAWALVYYLRKGAPLEKPPRYADVPAKYVAGLLETGDPDKATDYAFQGVDMKAFRKDFIRFWKSGSKRGFARRNNNFRPLATSPAADAAVTR